MDNVSRVVPYKNKTLKVKNSLGNYERISIQIMEVTLRQCYTKFCAAHPEMKIDRCTFEKLRPKYVRLKRCAQRLVCACSYHLNIDYLRRSLSKLLKMNDVESDFLSTNEKLCDFLLCGKNVRCIMGNCSVCKDFSKLKSLNSTDIKCSKECCVRNIDCTSLGHTIKTKQFEKILYTHKGKEKKKIALVDKYLSLISSTCL